MTSGALKEPAGEQGFWFLSDFWTSRLRVSEKSDETRAKTEGVMMKTITGTKSLFVRF